MSVFPAGKKSSSKWGKAVRPSQPQPVSELPSSPPWASRLLPTHPFCCFGCLAPLLIITPNLRRHLGPLFSCPSTCLCRLVQCLIYRFSLAVRPSRLADALRCATRTKLSQAEPRPSPSGCSRSSEDWQPEESFGTGASRTTRPDSTPEDQIVSSSGPNLGLGALHPSLKGHPSTVGA